MASIQVNIPLDNTPVPFTRCTSDNLPDHVKGSIKWQKPSGIGNRYYIPQRYSPNNVASPVEFINNYWYGIVYSGVRCTYTVWLSHQIEINNPHNIGYWNITDPQHPEYQPPSCTPSCTGFQYNPSGLSSSSGSSTASAHTAQSVDSIHDPNSPAITKPTLSLDTTSISFSPIAPPETTPARPPSPPDVTMLVNTTTTTGTAPMNSLKGVVPAVFNRDHSKSDSFWNEFCQ
jgi:hypothetical protein